MTDTSSEGKNVEFSRDYSDAIIRAVVAYLNTEGGTIYIGLDEFGAANDMANGSEIIARVAKLVSEGISPNALDYVASVVETVEGKRVVVVRVSQGASRPYWLNSRGLTPDGVLLRANGQSIPASQADIVRLINISSNNSYELSRSLNQKLTFSKARSVFEQHKAPFDDQQFYALGLYDSVGTYTNLARLLSDQCESTIKVAIFQGTQENQLHDRLELSGSIFQQYEDAFAYLDQYNRVFSRLQGTNRGDFRDYPPELLRELLLNAIIHRDYRENVSTIARLYHDHLELVSYGGLPLGLSFEEALLGVSAPRNPMLAKVFYTLDLVETSGVGLQKIRQAYDGYVLKPQFNATQRFFKSTLYNAYEQRMESRRHKKDKESMRVAHYAPVKISVAPTTTCQEVVEPQPEPRKRVVTRRSLTVDAKRQDDAPVISSRRRLLSERERRVLSMFQTRDAITCADVEERFMISQASAAAILRRLVDSGRIVLCGAGSNIWYRRP
ncbi:MAG: ATP-binding protein [Planctomycetia bacterium]|nr:ATP-binding protein [Planctomycetia bacterium]